MGGDQKDSGPMDDDSSDELDPSSEDGVVKRTPRPQPVARISESGHPVRADNETFVDLGDGDLDEVGAGETMGDLPPPETQPGAIIRTNAPTAPVVGVPSLQARPKLAPSLRAATTAPDPSDGTSAFSKEALRQAAEEEGDDPTPMPPPINKLGTAAPHSTNNNSAAVDGTPEPVGDREWYEGGKPTHQAEVEYDLTDEVPIITSAASRRGLFIGGAIIVMATAAVAAIMILGGGGLGIYALFNDSKVNNPSPVAVAPPAEPVPVTPAPEPEMSPTIEYFVLVTEHTVLAPVTVNDVLQKCTIVEYERSGIEGAGLGWPNLSTYERWELCSPNLRKGAAGGGGGHLLVVTVGEGDGAEDRSINLEEVIKAGGGEDYTPLPSTPTVMARCWGQGQINGDGQPSCTKKPLQFAELNGEPVDEPVVIEAPAVEPVIDSK